MRRILLLVIAVAVAGFAGWYFWKLSQQTSSASVSALLPRETIFLAHVPDFNRTRDQWNHSDLCQLYREPAVQDFLRKPLAKLSKKDAASQTLREIEGIDPKNAFFAVTSSYAASFYLQPKMISERLTALRAAIQPSGATNERPLLEQLRSISGAMRFESGKIHDLLFLGMPKLEQDAALTRSSLTLGTKE